MSKKQKSEKDLTKGQQMGSKSELMRGKILHAFNDLIYQNGYNETTLRQLADLCGISRGHLYFYFKKKEDLQNALSEDLYGKINLILDEVLQKDYESLGRYVILHILINYLIAMNPDLYRVSAECAEHMDILDYKAQLACRSLRRAYKEKGFKVETELLRPACACATSGEYAIIRTLYGLRRELDYLDLSEKFFQILFQQTRFPEGERYLQQGIEWFQRQNREELLQQVYKMDAYNYTFDDGWEN